MSGEVPRPGGTETPRRPRLIFLAIGVVLAAGLGVGLFTSLGATGPGATPGVGATVPGFSLPRPAGGALTQSAGSGPEVLVFFASWCAPCQSEMPALAAAYRNQSAAARVPILGVDGMDPTANALAFVRRSGVTFPVVADADYTVTSGIFAFTGEPDAVFVDRTGTIVHVVHGPISATTLRALERGLR